MNNQTQSKKPIELDKEFEKLNKKLNLLIERENNPKKIWVKVGIIQELTGWDHRWLRKARDNKIIEYRKLPGDKLEYNLESLPAVFHRKQN